MLYFYYSLKDCVDMCNILFNISCKFKGKKAYVCRVTELLALLSTFCSVTKREGWFKMKKSKWYQSLCGMDNIHIRLFKGRCSSVRSGNSLGDLGFELYPLYFIVFSQYLMYFFLAESTWKLVGRSSVLNYIFWSKM